MMMDLCGMDALANEFWEMQIMEIMQRKRQDYFASFELKHT
jgi:hypothetical protein